MIDDRQLESESRSPLVLVAVAAIGAAGMTLVLLYLMQTFQRSNAPRQPTYALHEVSVQHLERPAPRPPEPRPPPRRAATPAPPRVVQPPVAAPTVVPQPLPLALPHFAVRLTPLPPLAPPPTVVVALAPAGTPETTGPAGDGNTDGGSPEGQPGGTSTAPPPVAPTPPTDRVFDLNEVDVPPQLLVRVPPVYPPAARRQGLEGWVRVAFVVDTAGAGREFRVAGASSSRFEEAALTAVKRWQFRPARRAGQPALVRCEVTVRFALTE